MAGVQLQVLVADLFSRSMFFQVAADTKVTGFKNLVMERCGISAVHQCIAFAGQALSDAARLGDFCAPGGGPLLLLLTVDQPKDAVLSPQRVAVTSGAVVSGPSSEAGAGGPVDSFQWTCTKNQDMKSLISSLQQRGLLPPSGGKSDLLVQLENYKQRQAAEWEKRRPVVPVANTPEDSEDSDAPLITRLKPSPKAQAKRPPAAVQDSPAKRVARLPGWSTPGMLEETKMVAAATPKRENKVVDTEERTKMAAAAAPQMENKVLATGAVEVQHEKLLGGTFSRTKRPVPHLPPPSSSCPAALPPSQFNFGPPRLAIPGVPAPAPTFLNSGPCLVTPAQDPGCILSSFDIRTLFNWVLPACCLLHVLEPAH
jgi:hypothetical protein